MKMVALASTVDKDFDGGKAVARHQSSHRSSISVTGTEVALLTHSQVERENDRIGVFKLNGGCCEQANMI